jgi:hypothetical protein
MVCPDGLAVRAERTERAARRTLGLVILTGPHYRRTRTAIFPAST